MSAPQHLICPECGRRVCDCPPDEDDDYDDDDEMAERAE